MTQPTTAEPADHATAESLHESVRLQSWNLYRSLPTVITTTRHGTLEDGWRILGARNYAAIPEVLMAPTARQAARERLARLIHAYCDHPEADPYSYRRNPTFPRSVELYLG